MVAQVMVPRAPARRAREAAGLARAPFVAIGLVVLLGLLALLYISQNSAISTLGYEIKRLEAEQGRWIARNEQLRLEIGQLESQSRIEDAATQRGFAPPERVTFVRADASALPRKDTTDQAVQPRTMPLPAAPQQDALAWLRIAIRQLQDGAMSAFPLEH